MTPACRITLEPEPTDPEARRLALLAREYRRRARYERRWGHETRAEVMERRAREYASRANEATGRTGTALL